VSNMSPKMTGDPDRCFRWSDEPGLPVFHHLSDHHPRYEYNKGGLLRKGTTLVVRYTREVAEPVLPADRLDGGTTTTTEGDAAS
jgi:hypothetical protein